MQSPGRPHFSDGRCCCDHHCAWKNIPKETIDLANKEEIALISSPFGMFELAGRLYKAGLPSLESPVGDGTCSCDE